MFKNISKGGGLILALSASSGVGKSTLARALLSQDDNIQLSVSATTRSPRPGEKDGLDYHFKTKEQFEKLLQEDKFLEHTKIYNNHYGTIKDDITNILNQGIDVLLDIDWHGAANTKKYFPNVVSIFILPPSMEELYQRLYIRGQNNLDDHAKSRLALAKEETRHAKDYDYIIINDDLNVALKEIQAVLLSERLKLAKPFILNGLLHTNNAV